MRTAKIMVIVGAALLASVAVGAIAAVASLTLTRPAPEVQFSSLSGEELSTSGLRGKVVVVNFWATYCPDCLKEMPKFIETHQRYAPRGYETLAIAVRQDNPGRVAKYAEANALPFKVAIDSKGELAREFGNVRITPMTFVIDKKGKVLRRYVGEPNWDELHRVVEGALAS